MIPENPNKTDYVELVIDKVLQRLEKNGYCSLFARECYSEETAKKVAQMFADKKYYVKMNYFLNGQMQMLVVSKSPIRLSGARMIDEVVYR